MAGAEYELPKAMDTVLKADAALAGLVAGRIYDRVPPSAKYPYIQIGEGNAVSDRMDCLRSWTVYASIHVWSIDVGFGEAKRIMGAVDDCLDGAALQLETLRLIFCISYKSQVFRDADGLTSHGIVEFRAVIEKRTA